MSEEYLRFGLLLVAVAIVGLILLEGWHRKRRLKQMQSFESSPISNSLQKHIEPELTIEKPAAPAANKADILQDGLLMVSVLARQGAHFSSYDLLQAIFSAGFQFGEMNLFHYFREIDHVKLFSLASATKTGEFDLNHIGDFSCKGLILFLDLNAVIEPKKAFDLMLSKAQQLADDLDGDLYADPRTPWNLDMQSNYEKIISAKNQVELGCLA